MPDNGLPYPVAAGYAKPISNVMINVGTDKHPVYEEYNTYPPFPWKLSSPDEDHTGEDALAFWNLALELGAAPAPLEASKVGFEEAPND